MTSFSDKTFFSYATVAPMSLQAFAAAQQFGQEFYEIGPPEVLYKYDPYVDYMAAEAAKLLNCSPDEITYIKNTTEGINIAADALPLHPGDEILVLGNEYPANLLPWLKKRRDGLNVRVIAGTDSVQAYEDLVAAINPATKAIAISAIQYYDGYETDLGQLSRICREKDIFLVLDAVQKVGIRKIDLQQTSVDFLFCGGQKYLQAGMGIGFMYINKDILNELNHPRVGIRSMEGFAGDSYTLKPSAARFQDGTQNMSGIVALHASLKYINEQGIDIIEHKSLGKLRQIKNILREYEIPFIDHGDKQGNIISMQVPDPQSLFVYLKDRNVYIKAIKDVARLSFIHETTLEDAEILAKLTRQWLDEQS
jgi:cysteine desulfurase/selenocysteine lyase